MDKSKKKTITMMVTSDSQRMPTHRLWGVTLFLKSFVRSYLDGAAQLHEMIHWSFRGAVRRETTTTSRQ